MATVGDGSLPPTTSLVAAAFGSLVSTPVYTSQEYQALLKRDAEAAESAQKLDMARMYEHTLIWGQLGKEPKPSGARLLLDTLPSYSIMCKCRVYRVVLNSSK